MDVNLYHTTDDGEINIVNGVAEMSGGLPVATYLSLFGGNEDDNGMGDNHLSWWGNLSETEESRKYRSETQNLLASIPAIPNNLKRIEQSAKRDLAWMLSSKVASSVSVSTSMPALNTVKIVVDIEAEGIESQFEYVENWKAGK